MTLFSYIPRFSDCSHFFVWCIPLYELWFMYHNVLFVCYIVFFRYISGYVTIMALNANQTKRWSLQQQNKGQLVCRQRYFFSKLKIYQWN